MMDPLQDLRRYASSLVESVDSGRARGVIAEAATMHPVRRAFRGPRIGVLAAAATLFVLANTGLALAANPSVPGDLLYPVDRFYERVVGAVGGPGSPALERLEEAAVLVDRGEVSSALATAAEAMEQAGDAPDLEVAREALLRAASETEAGAGPGLEAAEEVRQGAAQLLVLAREVVDAARAGELPAPAARAFAEEALRLAEVVSGAGGPSAEGKPRNGVVPPGVPGPPQGTLPLGATVPPSA